MNATTRPDQIPLLADGDTLGVVGMGVMGLHDPEGPAGGPRPRP